MKAIVFGDCGGVELNDKAGSGGSIILEPHPCPMLRHDVAHNGQSQTRAASLGRKIGQKQLLFIGRRYATAGIGNRAAPPCPSEDCEVAICKRRTGESLIASAALSTRLTITRLICSRSIMMRGRCGSSTSVTVDIRPACPQKPPSRSPLLHSGRRAWAGQLGNARSGKIRQPAT